MDMGHQISSLLCGIFLATVVGQDCIYKECLCGGTSIYCSGSGLTSIPHMLYTPNTTIDVLFLDANSITSIPRGSLPPNLQELSMMSNPLTFIDDFAFNDSITTLQVLVFSNVSFARLPNAFLPLKNIFSIEITDSNIADWNAEVMKAIGQSLNVLYVKNCGLTVWPDPMTYLSNLTNIDLSDNNMSVIPDDALDNVANTLTSLILKNNSLTSIPKAFSNLTSLKELNLQQNKISDVSRLPGSSKLDTLSLNINNIFDADQLSKSLLNCADSVNYLNLANNRLSAIPNMENLLNLQNLDLSQNRISNAVSGSLPPGLRNLVLRSNLFTLIPKVMQSVKLVDETILQSNMIREIHAEDFPPWAVWAEFQSNLITELTDTSFPENASLQSLYLDNNPVSRISNNAFKNIPLLNTLSMRYTQMTRLPAMMSPTANLQTIDFTGNPNLICTCSEKNLQQWISSLSSYMVSGDCGLTSIYYFYTVLSLACPM